MMVEDFSLQRNMKSTRRRFYLYVWKTGYMWASVYQGVLTASLLAPKHSAFVDIGETNNLWYKCIFKHMKMLMRHKYICNALYMHCIQGNQFPSDTSSTRRNWRRFHLSDPLLYRARSGDVSVLLITMFLGLDVWWCDAGVNIYPRITVKPQVTCARSVSHKSLLCRYVHSSLTYKDF